MPENLALTIGENGGNGLGGLVPLAMRYLQNRETTPAIQPPPPAPPPARPAAGPNGPVRPRT
jgi:hypothetical protein